MTHTPVRSTPVFLALLACVLCPSPASAEDTKLACVSAHEQAQALRRDGHLRAARKQLIDCSRDACPALVRQDCGPWLEQVSDEQPTVALAVRDVQGRDTAAARIFVDGELVAEAADGKPVDIDPGEHSVRVSLPDGHAAEQHVLIRDREKGRVLSFDFTASQRTPLPLAAPTPTRPAPDTAGALRITLPAALATGAGVVALGSWAYFGLTGRSHQSDLEGSCSPNCSPSSIDDVRHRYLAADISLGVAVVSLGLASYFVLISRAERPSAAAVQVGAVGLPHGGAASLHGCF